MSDSTGHPTPGVYVSGNVSSVKWKTVVTSRFSMSLLHKHSATLKVILVFKDIHFSYNTAPKCRPTSSSGFQTEPVICFIAGRKAGCTELTVR